MNFDLPDHLPPLLERMDAFIEAEIVPLQEQYPQFFDERREFARTDLDRGGLPSHEWEDLLARMRAVADAAGWLRYGLPGLLAPVLGPGVRVGRVESLSGGASRQTWGIWLRDGDGRQHELVLRASDHDDDATAGMELEAASLRAAAAAGMPVPAVLCASDDAAALGFPYLISNRVPGESIPRRILRSAAAHALAIVERELARGAADQGSYVALLARLGAVDEAALAAQIRAGRRDHQLAEIAGQLRGIVTARLAVAHPGYDPRRVR